MNIGLFDTRIVLKNQSTSSINRFGESQVTYVTSSVWSKIEEKSGNTSNFNGVIDNSAQYNFTIRYNSSFTENSEILFDSRTFSVDFIETLGRYEYQKIVTHRKSL